MRRKSPKLWNTEKEKKGLGSYLFSLSCAHIFSGLVRGALSLSLRHFFASSTKLRDDCLRKWSSRDEEKDDEER